MLAKAEAIARGAGQVLLEKTRTGFEIEYKGTIDPVTDADRAAEDFVVSELQRLFPQHSIMAEEGGFTARSEEYVWVIDPLDGTTNFAHRYPHYAVSMALAKGGEIVLGVVYNPVLDECFSAEKGGGAFLNGKPVEVSRTERVIDSLLATGFPYDVATTERDNMLPFKRAMKASQGVRSFGAAALDLCHVACGRLDGFWERDIKPWDIAAASLIVAEAGGRVTAWADSPFDPFGRDVIATNGIIHAELLQLITV